MLNELANSVPVTANSPLAIVDVVSIIKLVVLIVTVLSLGILVIVLIEREKSVRLMIDNTSPMNVEIISEIFSTSDFLAKLPVGNEYGDTKNGLLLFDMYILAFVIAKLRRS